MNFKELFDPGPARQRNGIRGNSNALQAVAGKGINLQRFFDEDLYQELCMTMIKCIHCFHI